MGVTEYPCPGCGQAQKIRAPNGQEVNTQQLCAACAEKKANEAEKARDHSEEADNLKKGHKAAAR